MWYIILGFYVGPSNEPSEELTKRVKADISDVDSLDIGRFVSMAAIDDDTKLSLINNHWKPPPDFKFPSSETSRRKFCASWLNRWSWLCYSKLYDGAFCLSCVLFGHQTGHNGSKLSKLFKEPLTNWQSAVTRMWNGIRNIPIFIAIPCCVWCSLEAWWQEKPKA